MVTPNSYDEDHHTYRDVKNRLIRDRSKEEFEEVLNKNLDDNVVSGCQCEDEKDWDWARFHMDKLAVLYCRNCDGVWEKSLPGNYY